MKLNDDDSTEPQAPLNSQWLEGSVRHRRKSPVAHGFEYHTGMLALDVDEFSRFASLSRWVSVERFNWMSLRRSDYLDPEIPSLRNAVQQRVTAATGWCPDGTIELITHPRYLGYVFNPVSFYFCYRAGENASEGAIPAVILAQITNTPWHDRHIYCLECDEGITTDAGWHSQHFEFSKRFHVSPFNPMNQDYRWTFSFRGKELRIHMNADTPGQEGKRKVFDATLVVQRTPLTRKTLHRSLRQFPLESVKVVAGIYWHALRLKLKGAPFYTHPDKLDTRDPHFKLGQNDQGFRDDAQGPTTNTADTAGKRVSSWRT